MPLFGASVYNSEKTDEPYEGNIVTNSYKISEAMSSKLSPLLTDPSR